MPRNSELTLNSQLASVLRTLNPAWEALSAERTQVLRAAAGQRPDILLPDPLLVLETEFAPAATVEADARQRLGTQLQATGRPVEQVLAVILPPSLQTAPQHLLDEAIRGARYQYCTHALTAAGAPTRWPAQGWLTGDVSDLATCMEYCSLSASLLEQTTQVLDQGVQDAAAQLPPGQEIQVHLGTLLHQSPGQQTDRMALAIVANAVVFHLQIESEPAVPRLPAATSALNLKRHLLQDWQKILDINYWPIFSIASDVLEAIPDLQAQSILERLLDMGVRLARMGATRLTDLGGRMFQRLIADRKFLATFYTLPGSAALLAHLAAARLTPDWSSAAAVTDLRVGDLACGTGALLGAVYEVLRARHRHAGGNDKALHADMLEQVFHAADIMPAATHMTAMTLSSAHPGSPFAHTQIHTMPYGPGSDGTVQIGSLELLSPEPLNSLFGTGRVRLQGQGRALQDEGHLVDIPHHSLDLVIMNPPFTRPTNHGRRGAEVPVPSFAGFDTSGAEQTAMSRRLQVLRRPEQAGHGNAGLGSNFLDLAHVLLRPGGVLALVLPLTVVQGAAWEPARQLLKKHYQDCLIVSLTAIKAQDRAFSADTDLAEILLVATRKTHSHDSPGAIRYANLHQRPANPLEAYAVARALSGLPWASGPQPFAFADTATEIGIHMQTAILQGGCVALRHAELAAGLLALTDTPAPALCFPRLPQAYPLSLVPLARLGDTGLVDRDLNGADGRGPFDIHPLSKQRIPTYPALWAHDQHRERHLEVQPDREAQVRPGQDAAAQAKWSQTASRLHFTRDFRINSQSLAACLTPEPCIGGTAWPNFLVVDELWEPLLVLWANSTLGLMLWWWLGTRQQPGRARLTLSRLPDLPVLDPRVLTEAQLTRTRHLYDDFKGRVFLPA